MTYIKALRLLSDPVLLHCVIDYFNKYLLCWTPDFCREKQTKNEQLKKSIPSLPEMFLTYVRIGEVWRRSGMKEKGQKNTGKQTRAFRRQRRKQGGLDRFSVWGDRNLSDQKQHQEGIIAGDWSNVSETGYDRSAKCLTEEQELLSRWTKQCWELNNHESCDENAVLDCSQPHTPIRRSTTYLSGRSSTKTG